MAFRNDSLIVAIIRSSPNLKCFNISHNDIGDEVVEALAHTCHELEYLELGGCGFITEASICNVIRSCPKLQHLELGFCDISNTTIKEIACSCPNLKYHMNSLILNLSPTLLILTLLIWTLILPILTQMKIIKRIQKICLF